MKLDFCCVCGAKEDLHQHHIVPVVLSGIKRKNDDSDNTITVCTYHHDIIHGVIKNRSADHSTLIKQGMQNAKKNGKKIGRPIVINPDIIMRVYSMHLDNYSIRDISKACHIGIGTTYKVLSIIKDRQSGDGDSINITELYEEKQEIAEPPTFLDLYS